MDCTYSHPVNYLGVTPSSSVETFQFSQSHCDIQTATQSATLATDSAFIDIASTSAIAKGIHDITFVFWTFAILCVLYMGFRLGIWIYRR